MSEERIERIERYLYGEMDDAESMAFEAEMAADPSLQQDVSKVGLIDETIELAIEKDLRAELRTLESEGSNTKPPRTKSMRTIWGVAASVLIIVAASTFFFRRNSPDPLESFANEYYIEYSQSQLRSGELAQSPIAKGLELKDSGPLDEARAWFEEYTSDHPENMEALFVLADINAKGGDLSSAKQLYQTVISSGSILWGEKAEWNYILISLTDQWDERADRLLHDIAANEAHSYHPAANRLLELRSSN